MSTVTGSLVDIAGATMASRVGRLKFRLNGPNIIAGGSLDGQVTPTAESIVTPASDGSFVAQLISTSSMLTDAYFILSVEWLGGEGVFVDFPDWQIRVPYAGGVLSDLITIAPRSAVGPNQSLVLMGLTQPANLAVGQLWWKTDPNDPYGPANTGLLYLGGN